MTRILILLDRMIGKVFAGGGAAVHRTHTASSRRTRAQHRAGYRPCILAWSLLMPLCFWFYPLHASTLVLVSVDGFRWDYLDRPEARQMKALADRGVRVTKLRPVYPS